MIKTIPIEKEWLARLKENGFTADASFDKGQHEDLKAKLLTFGGEAVVLPRVEHDYKAIMGRARLFTVPPFKLKFVKGKPCHCHANVAKNSMFEGYDIMTGYALSEDGVWRQHSWNITHDLVLVETTEPRVAYFGFHLLNSELDKFILANA